MNNEQQELFDEVYKNYLDKAKNYTTEDLFYNKLSGVGDIIEGMLSPYTRDFRPYTQEEFIIKCKADKVFGEKWGLQIEERELSHQERSDLKNSPPFNYGKPANGKLIDKRLLDSCNVPTKLITVTYKDKTIESYE
jgi:hypothetical protein